MPGIVEATVQNGVNVCWKQSGKYSVAVGTDMLLSSPKMGQARRGSLSRMSSVPFEKG